MSKKQDKIDKAIRIGCYVAGAYFVGTAIAGAIKKHRAEKAEEEIEEDPEEQPEERGTVEGVR